VNNLNILHPTKQERNDRMKNNLEESAFTIKLNFHYFPLVQMLENLESSEMLVNRKKKLNLKQQASHVT